MANNRLVGFLFLAGIILLLVYGASYIGLQSVLASTSLPLKLTVGDFKNTYYGVSIAGIGLRADVGGPCPGTEPQLGAGGRVVGVSCLTATLSWNGQSLDVDSNTKNFLLGGFLNISKVDIAKSYDDIGGSSVTIWLYDVKNFYETKFTSYPNLVKLQHGSVPATVEYKSLLSQASLGGLTIKDDTKILRTETEYRFLDEFPIKPGVNNQPVYLNDKTLGAIDTSAQPHFYVVQTTITYANDPNRASTSSGNLALQQIIDSIIAARQQQTLNGLTTPKVDINLQTYNNPLLISSLMVDYEWQLQNKANADKNILSTLRNAQAYLKEEKAVKVYSESLANAIAAKLTQLEIDVIKQELSKHEKGLELLHEYEPSRAAALQEKNKAESDLLGQQLETTKQSLISAGVNPESIPAQSQSIFNLQAIAKPALPAIGSGGSAGFLVSNAQNDVYKFLFLEGSTAKYEVGPNLDYSKYKLISDQTTPFSKKIVLKAGYEPTTSRIVAVQPVVEENSAAYSRIPLSVIQTVTGTTPATGAKTMLVLTLLALAGIIALFR